MKKMKQNGLVLILVITLIALIGLEMFVLAGGSNTILFQADTAYLRAVRNNLVASGLAWTKQNVADQGKKIFDKTIELDVTDMKIRDANLSVIVRRGATASQRVGIPSGKEVQVQVSTSCSKSRQALRSDDKYAVGL
jgi:hypothetical protein